MSLPMRALWSIWWSSVYWFCLWLPFYMWCSIDPPLRPKLLP